MSLVYLFILMINIINAVVFHIW